MIKLKIALKLARVLIRLYLKRKFGGKGLGIGNFKYNIGEETLGDKKKLRGIAKVVKELIGE